MSNHQSGFVVEFPSVDQANEDGLLAIGASTHPQVLIQAYTSGIFPWPVDPQQPLAWFAPDPRGVILSEDIHFSKSLLKFERTTDLTIRVNACFDEVIKSCANVKRAHEQGTWIYSNIISGYSQLFQQKKAYCISVHRGDELVGGLYGVCIGELISGESMFFKEKNASKLALMYLLRIIKSHSIPFLDTQMVTPIIESFGGSEIPREDFMQKLSNLNLQKDRDSIFK